MASSSIAASPAPARAIVGDTLNQAWKNDKTKFGFKMLEKMGWTEGKGLGKNEDGVSEHVRVTKKSNNLGLGATRDQTGAAGWASTALSFNGVLEALGKAYGNGSARVKKGKKSKKGTNIAKDRDSRKGRGGDDKQDGGSDSDDSASEEAGSGRNGGGAPVSSGGGGARGVCACPSRARRVLSKDVTSFSTADLRAILGQSAGPSLPSYPVIGRGPSSASSVVSNGQEEKAIKRVGKTKNKWRREESDAAADVAAAVVHRPRTRSMDLAEPSNNGAAGGGSSPSGDSVGHRPRTRSMDHAEGEASADARIVAAGTAHRDDKPRKKSKKTGNGAPSAKGAEASKTTTFEARELGQTCPGGSRRHGEDGGTSSVEQQSVRKKKGKMKTTSGVREEGAAATAVDKNDKRRKKKRSKA